MLHPLSSLFKQPRSLQWDEVDIRHFIQDYLRRQLRSEAVYCEHFSAGTAQIRVGSAALQQAVRLWEYDLRNTVERDTGQSLQRLQIRS